MKKVMFLIATIAMMLGIATFGESPKIDVQNPEVYLGIGSSIINTKGTVKEYNIDFATNYTLGVRAYVLPKLSLNLDMTRDNLKLGSYQAMGKYDFAVYQLKLEYWMFKNAYICAGPAYFTTPTKDVDKKYGYSLGTGFKSQLSEHFFINCEAEWLKVSDFVLPENTGNLKFLVGYQF